MRHSARGEALLGRIVDPLGRPLDGLGEIVTEEQAEAGAPAAPAAASLDAIGSSELARIRFDQVPDETEFVVDDASPNDTIADFVEDTMANDTIVSLLLDHTLPTNGTLVDNGDGTWNYNPAEFRQLVPVGAEPDFDWSFVSVRGALMPDAHLGYGLPIGGVLATENAVIPYAVGVDIACRYKTDPA